MVEPCSYIPVYTPQVITVLVFPDFTECHTLSFEGLVAELDGSKIYRETVAGSPNEAEKIGIQAAKTLLSSGAGDVLKRLYES